MSLYTYNSTIPLSLVHIALVMKWGNEGNSDSATATTNSDVVQPNVSREFIATNTSEADLKNEEKVNLCGFIHLLYLVSAISKV